MDVNLLGNEELKYEIIVRGLPLAGTFAQRRAELRAALRLEREGRVEPPTTSPFDPVSELCLCGAKLYSIERDILSFDHSNRDNEHKKISTLLEHVRARIQRIQPNTDPDQILRNNLISRFGSLCRHLESIYNSQPVESVDELEVAQPRVEDFLLLEDLPPHHISNTRPPTTSESPSTSVDHRRLISAPIISLESWNYSQIQPSRSNVPVSVARQGPVLDLPPARDQSVHEPSHIYPHGNVRPTLGNQPISLMDASVADMQRLSVPEVPLPTLTSHRAGVFQSSALHYTDRSYRAPVDQCNRVIRDSRLPPECNGPSVRPSVQQTHIAPNPTVIERVPMVSREPVNADDPQVRFSEPEASNFSVRQPDANSTHHQDSLTSNSIPIAELAKRLADELQFSPRGGVSSQPPYFENNSPIYKDISRWNLRFDGQGSLSNFLERLEELRLSRGLSKTQLLRSAPELFTKDALLWYRTCSFHDWDDLVVQLRDAFMPYDYEFSLWDEIRRRTQGSQEKVISFVVAMENMFRKLPQTPSEATKLQLIKRNLLPYLQSRLATHKTSSVHELLQLARSIEETEQRLQRFVAPPTNYRQLLEPELAYHKPNYSVHAVESSLPIPLEPTQSSPSVPVEAIVHYSNSSESNSCWNCGGSGHRFRQCEQARKMFCFRCGADGVTSRSCPRCSKNEQTVRQ